MKKLSRLLALLALSALLHVPAAVAGEGATPRHRLVIQVSDNDEHRWNLVMSNVRNVQADLGKQNVEVEVVAYGPGLGMLKDDTSVANKIMDAMADGVRFTACGNTMRAQHVSADDLVKGVGIAPAGVVRIMERQEQGWSYLRP